MLSRGRSGVWAPVAVFIGVVKSNDIIQIAGECVNHEWGHVFPHIEQEAANLMFQLPIDLNRKEGLCCPIVVLRFCVRKAHVQIHVAFNNIEKLPNYADFRLSPSYYFNTNTNNFEYKNESDLRLLPFWCSHLPVLFSL